MYICSTILPSLYALVIIGSLTVVVGHDLRKVCHEAVIRIDQIVVLGGNFIARRINGARGCHFPLLGLDLGFLD